MSTWPTCPYGSEDRRDRVLFEYHSFSLVVTCSLACLLLDSTKLRRVYQPLYSIVNMALLFKIASSVTFFLFYPYSEQAGNCTEQVIARVASLLVMFGELHQVYFIANVLDSSRMFLSLPGCGCSYSFSLENMLRWAALVTGGTILCTVGVRHMFMILRNLWTLFIVSLQLHVIYKAKHRQDDDAEDGGRSALLDAASDAIANFEALSWLQIIPSCVALTDRLLELRGIHVLTYLDGVMLILENLVIYLFYLKILVLQEKANTLHVEIIRS